MRKIQVVGTGCPKCNRMAANVSEAVAALDLDADVEKITDLDGIVASGVLLTPGLIVNGRMLISGRVPSVEQIKEWLEQID
ncbi:MAG: TM0996/MTH895 family glutaredoxin-like protein [Candidatus Eisenbacteria sp.]|nr:TM0996/MTH895 family glutaredoxin-like protein [Candidatus Eisenbacteria bacterium]